MPGAEPVTAVANAVTEVVGALRPYLAEALAQRYENEATERIKRLADVAAGGDPHALYYALERLCAEAGHPAGVVSGKGITLSLEHYNGLVASAVNSIKLRKQLASLEYRRDPQ